jgi:phage portal protein BeeE
VGLVAGALTQWLRRLTARGLAADANRIDALSSDRATFWDRVSKAPFLTVNEKRAAAGYGAISNGDALRN